MGHASAPSFRLDLDGGSLAYQYEGNDIAVRPNSDYLVVAWVKTAHLSGARAYLTVFFLDRNGNRLAGTERTSELVALDTPGELRSGAEGPTLRIAGASRVGGMGDSTRHGVALGRSTAAPTTLAGDEPATAWRPIQIGMLGDVPDARYMGLAVWLTQQRVWDHRPPTPHSIQREDVRATAWFDDITVYRLPRIALKSASPGNVFGENEPVVLYPEITDPDGLNLSAKLTVRSADGAFSDERGVPILTGASGPEPAVIDGLPVGLYDVRLEASTQDVPLVWRTLRFARVPEAFSPPQSAGRGFGVVLDDIAPAALPGQRALLGRVRPELVKLPVWYAQRAITGETFEVTQAVDGYLQAIVESGGDPVGKLQERGSGIGNRESAIGGRFPIADSRLPIPGSRLPGPEARGSMRSMIDLLSESPLAWKPLIAGTWSRYTGLIHVWQVGADGDDSIYLDHRLPRLLATLRHEMAPLMSEPMLAAPTSTLYPPATEAFGDYRSVRVPASVTADEIPRHVGPLMDNKARGPGQETGNRRRPLVSSFEFPVSSRTWITLDSLGEADYPRPVRLADYARRLAGTYFLNPGAVFVAAPWDVQADLATTQVNPREEYLILRTVADLLGNTVPVSRTNIDGQAECLVFDRNGEAVLFVWDDYAPPEGRDHVLYLGEDAEQVDVWGRRTRIETVGDRQVLRVGPTPSFVVNTPTWLMEFRRRFRLSPSLVEASFSTDTRDQVFTNTYREPISGTLRIVGPENWDIRPSRATFALQPGQEFRLPLEIRFPVNAEAG
ncbi:MAG: hypothetical protein HY718_09675, partial [Planctomycetes bacterium]|nr:hypothetical protein [Planctomycetota bacterium]